MKANRQPVVYGNDEWKVGFSSLDAFLRELGLYIRDVAGDGNCLFRAIADQMFNDASRHSVVRQEIVSYLSVNRATFEPFIEDAEPFEHYVARMSCDREWGGHLELHCCARLYNTCVYVYQLNTPRFEIDFRTERIGRPNRIIRLSYHNGSHYCSVRQLIELGIVVAQDGISEEIRERKERKVVKTMNENNLEIIQDALLRSGYSTKKAIRLIQDERIDIVMSETDSKNREEIQQILSSVGWNVEKAKEVWASREAQKRQIQVESDFDEELQTAIQMSLLSNPNEMIHVNRNAEENDESNELQLAIQMSLQEHPEQTHDIFHEVSESSSESENDLESIISSLKV